MSEKVSIKTISVITLVFAGIVLIFGACVHPVDIQGFLEDETVQGVIDKNQEKVIIDPTSNCYFDLKAGNKKITGLNPNKYYMIESVKDDKGATVSGYPQYVWDDGQFDANLFAITRTKGSINGLTNDYTYKIRVAEDCTGSFTYSKNGVGNNPAPVDAGKITINPSANTDYFSITNINIPPYAGCFVMAVGVSPTSIVSPNQLPSASDFFSSKQTIGAGLTATVINLEKLVPSTVDYVFAKVTGTTVDDFKVLRVEIQSVTTAPVKVTDLIISGLKPVTKDPAKTSFTSPSSQYSGAVSWDKPLTDGKFNPAQIYTATITLTITDATYTFTGMTMDDFTVTDANKKTSTSITATTFVFDAVFPATDPVKVTDLIISGLKPVTEDPAKTNFTSPNSQYTGAVSWSPALTDGKFDPAQIYTATITLTAETGYTFAGVMANEFSVTGASSTTSTNGTITVTVIALFPATEPKKVTDDTIKGISVPTNGGTVVSTITNVTQYAGGAVSWSADGMPFTGITFAPDTQYTATFTLTAKTGFTFTGLPATGFFKVFGSTDAMVTYTCTANTATVTVLYTRTSQTPEQQITVNITFTGGEEHAQPTGDPPDISLASLLVTGSGSLTVTVTGTSTGISWYLNGTPLPAAFDNKTTITLDKTIPGILIVGTHKFTAIVDVGGKQYSASFTLKVTN